MVLAVSKGLEYFPHVIFLMQEERIDLLCVTSKFGRNLFKFC